MQPDEITSKMTSDDLIRRGNDYYEKEDYKKAHADYTHAIKIDPNSLDAYYNRAGCVFAIAMCCLEDTVVFKELLAQAIFDYTKVIEIEPNSIDAYLCRGNIFYICGMLGEAIVNVQQAINIDPQNTTSQSCMLDLIEDERKKNIFKEIKTLSLANQFHLLKICLIPDTALGKRFWKKEGLYSCSLDSGTLKEIGDYLKTIEPVMGNSGNPSSAAIAKLGIIRHRPSNPMDKKNSLDPDDDKNFKL